MYPCDHNQTLYDYPEAWLPVLAQDVIDPSVGQSCHSWHWSRQRESATGGDEADEADRHACETSVIPQLVLRIRAPI
jgi:hypothetical protein